MYGCKRLGWHGHVLVYLHGGKNGIDKYVLLLSGVTLDISIYTSRQHIKFSFAQDESRF